VAQTAAASPDGSDGVLVVGGRLGCHRTCPGAIDGGVQTSSEAGDAGRRRRSHCSRMGCFLVLLALISPRLVLVVLAIFSDVLSRAFDGWVVPLLGFFLLPWTTLAYAALWDWGPGRHVYGFEWFLVALAFFIDLSAYAGGRRARR
jgi:hypothetical protein